jgi:hypothetical protein
VRHLGVSIASVALIAEGSGRSEMQVSAGPLLEEELLWSDDLGSELGTHKNDAYRIFLEGFLAKAAATAHTEAVAD